MSKNVSGADNQQETKPSTQLFECSGVGSPETIRQIPHMDRTTATLIGLLFTDGCLSPKGKSSWRFYFSNKSTRLVAIFRESMMQCFALPSRRIRLSKTKDGLHCAIVGSKQAGDAFTRNFGTFRTLRYSNGEFPKAHLPVKELLRHGVAEDFLRAAFSCDGGVNLYAAHRAGAQGGTKWLIRGVYLACAHPKLREDYCKLLKALGIRARNVSKDGKVKIEAEEDIRAFHEKVGFIKGVHITHTSKFWPNIEKQELLNRLIESYGVPSSVYTLRQFEKVR